MKLRLLELREKAGLSQREVAAALGIHPSTQGRREKGHTAFPVSDLAIYAIKFNCLPADLIDGPHLLTPPESDLVNLFRHLDEGQQLALLTGLRASAPNNPGLPKTA